MPGIHLTRRLAAALLLVSTAVAARPGAAQGRVDCRTITTALQRNAREVEAWSDVARCGAPGAAALADALERNRASRDVAFWTRFGDVAWTIRHPALLRAALRVAGDSAASFPARALGLQIALTQHDPNANFAHGHHPLALEAILAGGVGERTPPGQPCIVPALDWVTPTYAAPLPPDADVRILATADAVGRDRRAPPTLRHMARCVAEELRGHMAAAGHGPHSH